MPGAGALTVAPSDATAAAAWGQGGGGPADPQALNRYSYVNNNPVNNIDPTGHVAPIRCPASDCRWRHDLSAWNEFEKGAAFVGCLVAGCSVDFEHDVIVGPTPSEQLAGMTPGGVVAKGSANVLRNVVKPFDIVTYGTKVTGLEMHHGVLDVWASANIKGYVSRGADTPAIALTKTQHDATRSVLARWRLEQTGSITGKVDWTKVSAREIQRLSEKMFDAAGVPQEARRAYYQTFHQYIYGER